MHVQGGSALPCWHVRAAPTAALPALLSVPRRRRHPSGPAGWAERRRHYPAGRGTLPALLHTVIVRAGLHCISCRTYTLAAVTELHAVFIPAAAPPCRPLAAACTPTSPTSPPTLTSPACTTWMASSMPSPSLRAPSHQPSTSSLLTRWAAGWPGALGRPCGRAGAAQGTCLLA